MLADASTNSSLCMTLTIQTKEGWPRMKTSWLEEDLAVLRQQIWATSRCPTRSTRWWMATRKHKIKCTMQPWTSKWTSMRLKIRRAKEQHSRWFASHVTSAAEASIQMPPYVTFPSARRTTRRSMDHWEDLPWWPSPERPPCELRHTTKFIQ